MVTGHPPFKGNTPLQILMRMAQEQPPAPHVVNPKVRPEVSVIIRKMMAPEFRNRYGTMDEVMRDLDKIEGLGTMSSSPLELQYPEAEAFPEGVPGRPVPVVKRRAIPREEGRRRPAPPEPSSTKSLVLLLTFLAIAAAIIWFLLTKGREKDGKDGSSSVQRSRFIATGRLPCSGKPWSKRSALEPAGIPIGAAHPAAPAPTMSAS